MSGVTIFSTLRDKCCLAYCAVRLLYKKNQGKYISTPASEKYTTKVSFIILFTTIFLS